METAPLKGLWTALVTPFENWNGLNNKVDYKALKKLLEMQIEAGLTWVLLLGTTAENPTLEKKEAEKIVKFAVKILKWKTKIMVNIGTYCTKTSIENIKKYNKFKAIDAFLVVNPYYNKPTQTGLFQHFTTIAKATKKPIIVYNIKGRTGVNLETNTLIDIISECPNIIGVKEASGDMIQMKEVIEQTWDHFLVFSWDDGLTYELIKNWGDGVISVASNCIPEKMKIFVDTCFKWGEKADKLNEKYQEFFNKLFIQTNPLPAKTFLAEKWIIKENFRLPLCPMDEPKKEEFLKMIKKYRF